MNFLLTVIFLYGSLCRPCNPPNFKELMEEYISLCKGMLFRRTTLLFHPFTLYIYFLCFLLTTVSFWVLSDLSRKILRGIALALGGSPDEFEGERAGDAFWVMRIIGYPGVSTTNGPGPTNDIGW
jgi:hypothetical protein